MNSLARRRENVSPEEERIGIVNRLDEVETGKTFSFRDDTDRLTFDFDNGITWDQLTQDLIKLGVLKPQENSEAYVVTKPLSSLPQVLTSCSLNSVIAVSVLTDLLSKDKAS